VVGFCFLGGPGSFAQNQGCLSIVLLDVLLDAGAVFSTDAVLFCRSLLLVSALISVAPRSERSL